jgi:hypothetical protein
MTKLPDTNKIISIAYIAAFILILFVIYKIMSAVGLIKTGKSKRADKEKAVAVDMLRTDEYFSPDYSKGKTFKSLGSNAANLYAQHLRKAIRGLGTDEEMLYTTFAKLYNKNNVSEVAAAYLAQYKNDLQTDLLNELTDKEVVQLMNIINELPER